MRLASLLLALVVAAPASASDETPIPYFPAGEQVCLGSGPRALPAPDAQADEVSLVRQGAPDPLSEVAAWNRLRAEQGLPASPGFQPVFAVVKLRRETRPRLAQLGCFVGDGGTLSCSVDCDGGGVKVRESGDTYALRSNGLRLGGLCGSSQERVWWKNGPHDTDFTLKRLDGPACKTVIESMRPAHAGYGKPIMDRIAEGRGCFRRVYSGAHLRGHKEQRVKEIRIDWKGFDPADGHRGNLAVSLTLRSGQTANQTLSCQPEGFAVQCFPKDHGDGDALLTRGKDGTLRLAMKGLEGELTSIGGQSLGKQDDVFMLDETPCGAPKTRAGLR